MSCDLRTNTIDIPQQADIARDEGVGALGVDAFELSLDARAGGGVAADEVDRGKGGVFGEFQERVFADAGGGADEDGCDFGREGGGEEGIGREDGGERDHLERWCEWGIGVGWET